MAATMRRKTLEAGEGVKDASVQQDDDPFPGIGMDDETLLGDTQELAEPEHRPDEPRPSHPTRSW